MHWSKTHIPVIKNTIKQISFENWSESSIIFQSFLFANIPAESTSYAPTFFAEMKGYVEIQANEKKSLEPPSRFQPNFLSGSVI